MQSLLLIGFAIRQTFIKMPEPIIMPKTCEGWYQEIDNNDYVNKEWLKRVMFCESTCRFDVINTSGRNKGSNAARFDSKPLFSSYATPSASFKESTLTEPLNGTYHFPFKGK